MSNYTKATDFAAKDTLITGNPAKVIKGVDINTEFTAIETAIATKYDSATLGTSGGSALVGFLPAGTGAVATTVQTKLREFVSVNDFGASSSASAATNTAAIALASASAKSLYFPDAGIYQISGPILPASNTEWFSHGQATIQYTTNTCLIDATSVSNWKMHGLVIDGNYTAYASGNAATTPWGVRTDASDNIEIYSNHFKNLYRIGVYVGHQSLTPSTAVIVRDNLFEDIGSTSDAIAGTGMAIAVSSANGVIIKDNIIRRVTGLTSATAGIDVEVSQNNVLCTNIEICGNQIHTVNNSYGIQATLNAFTGCTVDNLNIHDNLISTTGTLAGIRVLGFGTTLIDNNTLISTQGIKTQSMDTSTLKIRGNVINGTTTGHGIQCVTIKHVTITDNTILGVGASGISVYQPGTIANALRSAVISNNTVHVAANHGIIGWLFNFTMAGNTLIDCSTASNAYYYITGWAGGSTSINGTVSGNTMEHLAATTPASFINCEVDLFDNVTWGPQSFYGGTSFTFSQDYNAAAISKRNPGIKTDVMPTAGTWRVGDVVYVRTPVEAGAAASKYIIYAWIRLTSGSGNVLNTDWFQQRTLTGN